MTGPNETVKADRYNITYGMVQGSCLGPLLLRIFMNDVHLLPMYSNIILFANDTTVFNSIRSQKFLKYTLEHNLNLMTDWFKANKLLLNLSKTVGIKFWDNSSKINIKVDNMEIPMAEWMKFLGVYIDYKLTWHIHMNHLLDTLNTNRCMLSIGKNLFDGTCLKNIYFRHIHYHMMYGISTWNSMIPQCKISEISRIQKQCVQLICHSQVTQNINNQFKELNILSFDKT